MSAKRASCGLIQDFLRALQTCLDQAPPSVLEAAMFDTFKYVATRRCFCHPRTMGFLAKAAWSLPYTAAVEIDVHFNSGNGIRFNPDVVLRDGDGVVRLAVDFESPNSVDPRVIEKGRRCVLALGRYAGSANGVFDHHFLAEQPALTFGVDSSVLSGC